jgi:secondary thiamine-phosphate synthase enzyme
MAVQSSIEIKTEKGPSIKDITDSVERTLQEIASGKPGLVNIYLTGTTASIIINENEKGLIEDIINLFEKIAPEGVWRHDSALREGNAHAHLRNIITGSSISVPFDGNKLILGTWQRIFLVEWDTRPRNRTLVITFLE